MKRILLLLLLLLPVLASAQVTSHIAFSTRSVDTLPTTCTYNANGRVDEIYLTSGSVGFYTCKVAQNGWNGPYPTSAGGTVTSVTGTANQITVTGTATPVLSIPADFQAPGTVSIGLGAMTAPTMLTVGDTSSSTPRGIMNWQSSSDTASARFYLRKSRNTFASPAIVVTGDLIGNVTFSAYDGSSFLDMGMIRATVTGTVAATRVPTKLEFLTATDAAPSVATVALTLGADQSATFGGAVKSVAGKTLAWSNTLALAGTDSTTMTFPTTSATIARTDAGNTFTGAQVVSSNSATALTIGPNGATTPVLTINGSVASQTDGVEIKGNAVGNGVTLTATSSGSNAGITLTPKGSANIVLGNLTLTNPGSGITATFPSTSFTVARTDAGNTFTGNQIFASDNASDIGASGANRPRTGFFGTSVTSPSVNVNSEILFETGASRSNSTYLLRWGSTVAGAAQDSGLGRNAAGVVEVNSGTAGTFRDLVARNVAFSATESGVSPAITVGSGTGITVNAGGEVRTTTYKVTIINTALSAAATTADVTLATLPAKTQLNGIWADLTQTFTGGAVSAASMTCGKTAGGAEYLASFNVFTATLQRGLVDADLGTAMVRSAAVQGGDMPSWSATTAVQCRLTTTGANTSVLTQGSVTFYLRTTKLP